MRLSLHHAIAASLFLIPFFWFAWGEADFGGDSSRLYFLDPGAWLAHYGFSEINITDFGFHSPNYFLIPFLTLLKGLHVLFFGQVHLVLGTFNGFLLAGSFLTVYGILRALSASRPAALFGGLFFTLIPIMVYNWQRPLYTWHQIAVYPLLFWFLLQYVKRRQTQYLLWGLLVTLIFSVNFSVFASPNVFAFFPLILPLLFIYAALQHKVRWLLRGFMLFILLFLPLHSFHLVPQVVSLLSPTNNLYQNAFTSAGQVNRGRNYFESVRPMVKFVYNLTGFPQYSLYTKTGTSPHLRQMIAQYGITVMAAFFLFPLVIALGALSASQEKPQPRILFLSAVLLWLAALFLMTANIFGSYGPRAYAALFALPGFAMFRSFYGAFAVPLAFSYAVTFGLALGHLLQRLPHRFVRGSLVTCLLGILVYGAWPLLTGKVVNSIMPSTSELTLAHKFPPDFIRLLKNIQELKADAKILTLPLTSYDYQVIEGASGGAYVGPSPLGNLAGQHTYSGLSVFTIPGSRILSQEFFLDRVRAKDYRTLTRVFSLMNIGYIFENASPQAYREGFTGFPYAQDVWEIFPDNASIRDFIEKLGYQPTMHRGPYTLYANPESLLPHIYLPQHIVRYQTPEQLAEYLATSEEYVLPTAFFQSEEPLRVTTLPTDTAKLESKKINEMKYQVRIHNLTSDTPIVFSQAWHPGWKLYVNGHRLPDTTHTIANEYANAWQLDDSLGPEADLILEFAPRRFFYLGTAISLVTLAGIIIYLWRKISRS